MKRMTRNIIKASAVVGGIAGLALLYAKMPESPRYTNPRTETATVVEKEYLPATSEFFTGMLGLELLRFPEDYRVTLQTSKCAQVLSDKKLYEEVRIEQELPVTVWDIKKAIPSKLGTLYVITAECGITIGEVPRSVPREILLHEAASAGYRRLDPPAVLPAGQ